MAASRRGQEAREQLDVDVTAGAPITIVVQGHAKTEGGTFELTASM